MIKIDGAGRVLDFAMNDKCAAGTGRFLEVMARALEVDLEGFGEKGNNATAPSKISSICTVFAESEVISLISKVKPVKTLLRAFMSPWHPGWRPWPGGWGWWNR
ncbi:MAG: BadF/BadG/BcrA/BcrD ATPase family protein [Desulfobacterales bacterium]